MSSGFSGCLAPIGQVFFFLLDANLSDLNTAVVFAGAVYLNFFFRFSPFNFLVNSVISVQGVE